MSFVSERSTPQAASTVATGIVASAFLLAACALDPLPPPGSSSTGSGAPAELFSDCLSPNGVASGVGQRGASCSAATDCVTVCCACADSRSVYGYAACKDGKCASACDPSNDLRATACTSSEPTPTCWKCGQILNEALADGDDRTSLACAGAAASTWRALSVCAAKSCGAVCPGITYESACVTCLQEADASGGCADEFAACVAG